MKNRVLLGMSGGVDSSVVAMMLQKKGYEVVGITFIFSDLEERNDTAVCDARKLAQKLGIKHFVVDLREEFKRTIVNYFTNEYSKGRTPFPCAKCNPDIKFKNLNEYANEFDCNFIATGHYAKVDVYNNKKYVFQGTDSDKDQSFFLWGLEKNVLDKLILPLGTIKKSDTREYANFLGYNKLSKKKDSLGVCFIEGNNYRKFLESKGVQTTPGNFVNLKGEKIGNHKGIFNYTIGQRRGLGVNFNKPVFVYDINVKKNEIVLSGYEDLYRKKIAVNNLKFIDISEVTSDKIFTLKIRYRLQDTPCSIEMKKGDKAIVHLQEPLAMVAKGQTAVFYDFDRVIGGGSIESSE